MLNWNASWRTDKVLKNDAAPSFRSAGHGLTVQLCSPSPKPQLCSESLGKGEGSKVKRKPGGTIAGFSTTLRTTCLGEALHQPARPLVLALAFLSVLWWDACARRAEPNRQIWAEVDGKPIFRDEVERYYRSRLASASSETSKDEQALSLKLNILNELINNQTLLAHASRAGIDISEAEVDKRLADLRTPYSDEEFQTKLKDQGTTLNDFRRQVRDSLLVEKLINKEITSRVSVSDREIAEYYERNKTSFNVPETQYHLAQILVTPVPDPQLRNLASDDAKTPAAAEHKIKELSARLRRGEDFDKLAQAYSEDPTTVSGGGDMGFIPASALASQKSILMALQSLKVGQVSGIIRDSEGYHIVKILGREDAGQRPLSDPRVQNSIRQTLFNEKEQLLKTAYIEGLRDKARVSNYLAAQIVKAAGTLSDSKP
jgi:peptidyl-prolyl cis-trans isomerase SurA